MIYLTLQRPKRLLDNLAQNNSTFKSKIVNCIVKSKNVWFELIKEDSLISNNETPTATLYLKWDLITWASLVLQLTWHGKVANIFSNATTILSLYFKCYNNFIFECIQSSQFFLLAPITVQVSGFHILLLVSTHNYY